MFKIKSRSIFSLYSYNEKISFCYESLPIGLLLDNIYQLYIISIIIEKRVNKNKLIIR